MLFHSILWYAMWYFGMPYTASDSYWFGWWGAVIGLLYFAVLCCALHYTALPCFALLCITFVLPWFTMHCIVLIRTAVHCFTWHSLHCVACFKHGSIAQFRIVPHSAALERLYYSISSHRVARNCTTLISVMIYCGARHRMICIAKHKISK